MSLKDWGCPHIEVKLSGCTAHMLIQATYHFFPFWVEYSLCQLSVTMQVHARLTSTLFFFSTKILTNNTEEWTTFHLCLKKAELRGFLMRRKELWPIIMLITDPGHIEEKLFILLLIFMSSQGFWSLCCGEILWFWSLFIPSRQ